MLLIFTLSSRSRIWWHFNPHRCDKEEGNVVIILEMYASPEYTQRKKKKQEEAKKKKKKRVHLFAEQQQQPKPIDMDGKD